MTDPTNPQASAPSSSLPSPGRGWATTGIVLGGIVSVAANVAHSFVPPVGAPATWHPQPGAVVGTVFWPFFLFVAIEILARINWPTGLRFKLLRFLGLLPVALVAGIVSYRHMSGLLHYYGEDSLVAAIGPIAVDGLMVMATGALLATGHQPNAAATGRAASTLSNDGASTVTRWPASTQRHELSPVHADTATPHTDPLPEALIAPLTVPAHLVPTARFAVTNHESTTGRPITADELATRMSVTPDLAGQLLTLLTPDQLGHEDHNQHEQPGHLPARINGTPVNTR